HIRTVSTPETQMSYGETVSIQVAIDLNGLQAHDIKVELLLARKIYHPEILVPTENDLHKLWENHPKWTVTYPFIAEKPNNNEECLYTLNFKPDLCGGLSYRIRIYPIHSLLSDSYEMGMMKWV
ncbi:MAG: hypothetical protein KAH77_06420, partial [Thiomargarita sp.]|nr:hypothetical protein [Thiomargarita sp.]